MVYKSSNKPTYSNDCMYERKLHHLSSAASAVGGGGEVSQCQAEHECE